ncbi:flavodoxin [bacterium]|nr:flavodoxin [bacterium]
MKNILLCIFIIFGIFIFSGCNNKEKIIFTQGSDPDTKILIAYFSRAGEQRGFQRKTKIGNTAIIANMIAGKTGADIFEITPLEDNYPEKFEKLSEYAKKEKEENARPEILNKPENLDKYDIIFIGSPIWHEDMPMILYTFIESYDFTDKTIIPFYTYGWNEYICLSDKIRNITQAKEVKEDFKIKGLTAQLRTSIAQKKVDKWFDSLEF